MILLGTVIAIAGVVLLLIAALGLFLLPDALSRQHAATKSGTLALGLILCGCALAADDLAWWPRVVLILIFLLLTLPLASHMLARAAAHYAHSREALRDAPDPEREQDQEQDQNTR